MLTFTDVLASANTVTIATVTVAAVTTATTTRRAHKKECQQMQ
jgi:hypothetical protein